MVQGIKTVSFEEAVKVVKSGDRIHIHSVACAPQGLIQALCARGRAGELKTLNCNIFIRKALLLMQSRNSKVYSSWNRICRPQRTESDSGRLGRLYSGTPQ